MDINCEGTCPVMNNRQLLDWTGLGGIRSTGTFLIVMYVVVCKSSWTDSRFTMQLLLYR